MSMPKRQYNKILREDRVFTAKISLEREERG